MPFAPFAQVVVAADPADPVALRRADVRAVAEGDEEAAVRRVFCRVTVAGKRSGQFARFAPGLAFVVGKNDERVQPAAVLAEQNRDLLAVGRADRAGLAEVSQGVLGDDFGLRPGQPAVAADDLVNLEMLSLGMDGRIAQPAAVVVKEGHVRAVAALDHGAHGDDSAISGPRRLERLQRRPAFAVVFGIGDADAGGFSREHQNPRLAGWVVEAEQGGNLHRCGPVRGRGQALRPGQAAVVAFLVNNGAFAVPLGVGDQHRAVVRQQQGRGVAEVLPGLAVDDDLAVGFPGNVDGRNGVALGLRRRQRQSEQQGKQADAHWPSVYTSAARNRPRPNSGSRRGSA